MIKVTLISLSFLVCLSYSAPFDVTTQAPLVKLNCKGHNPNGFFVDEKDPHKFHECVNGQHVGDFTCPSTLIFDESKQVCNIGTVTVAPTPGPTTAAPVTVGPTTSAPVTSVSVSGPTKEPFVKLSCKGHNPNGFFVDEKDPQKFHECVNGEHIADFKCAKDLIFDEALQVCVGKTTGPPPTRSQDISCPEPSGMFPYPGNKHKFIECVGSHPYVFDCAANLVFDPVGKNCVYDDGHITDSPPLTHAPATSPTTGGPQTTGHTSGTSGTTSQPQTHPTGTQPTGAPTTQSSHDVDCSKDGYFADPTDKHRYVICSKGHKTVMTCPSGMVFNEAMEMCQ